MSDKITASFKVGETDVTGVPVVNPGDWFGKAWLVSMPMGNFASHYIVEADSCSDAIDEFSDSTFGHLIHVADEDLGDYPEDSRNYDGQGRVIDTDTLRVDGREGWDVKCPFTCLYHGEGIPKGGVSPLEYNELQNCEDGVREYIAGLVGGLHHAVRKSPVSLIDEAWQEAFHAGRYAGWDSCRDFYKSQFGDSWSLLSLIREIQQHFDCQQTLDEGEREFRDRAWAFVKKAQTYRDPQCRMERTPDGGFLYRWFGSETPTTWHSIETIPADLDEGRVRFTFERMLEEWMEKEASK